MKNLLKLLGSYLEEAALFVWNIVDKLILWTGVFGGTAIILLVIGIIVRIFVGDWLGNDSAASSIYIVINLIVLMLTFSGGITFTTLVSAASKVNSTLAGLVYQIARPLPGSSLELPEVISEEESADLARRVNTGIAVFALVSTLTAIVPINDRVTLYLFVLTLALVASWVAVMIMLTTMDLSKPLFYISLAGIAIALIIMFIPGMTGSVKDSIAGHDEVVNIQNQNKEARRDVLLERYNTALKKQNELLDSGNATELQKVQQTITTTEQELNRLNTVEVNVGVSPGIGGWILLAIILLILAYFLSKKVSPAIKMFIFVILLLGFVIFICTFSFEISQLMMSGVESVKYENTPPAPRSKTGNTSLVVYQSSVTKTPVGWKAVIAPTPEGVEIPLGAGCHSVTVVADGRADAGRGQVTPEGFYGASDQAVISPYKDKIGALVLEADGEYYLVGKQLMSQSICAESFRLVINESLVRLRDTDRNSGKFDANIVVRRIKSVG